MKQLFKNYFGKGAFSMFALILVCALIGVSDGSAFAAETYIPPTATVDTAEGRDGIGKHVASGETVVTEMARNITDEILISEYDKIVIKQRPYKTPLDTLLRYSGSRETTAISNKWGASDINPTQTTTSAAYTAVTTAKTATIPVTSSMILAKTDTVRVIGVYGFEKDGVTVSTTDYLQLYIKGFDTLGNPIFLATNGGKITSAREKYVPSIPAGSVIDILGRAAAEKDIQTPSYTSFPSASENYVQSFKCQVDVSEWYQKSKKLIQWDKQDIEQAAIYEYKLKMEKTLLYGQMGITYDDSENKGDIYTCNGITKYIKREFVYNIFTKNDLVDLTKDVFSGNIGSDKRVMFAGKDLIANISKIDYTQFKDITFNKQIVWGIKWNTIETNFGTIYMIHHEVMDESEDSANGYVIDPEYLVRYVFEQENKRELDKKTTGESNVDASVTTEVMCPGLKYSNCHLKIVYEP